jgi:predicted NAD/FAD-dependent oxidoreductase
MAQHSRRTTFAAGAVSFVVQHELWDGNVDDHSDQGVTILVTAQVGDKETTLLRFNCFDVERSYVYGPEAVHKLCRMDATVDGNPIGWSVKQLKHKLPDMLWAAGYEDMANKVDAQAVSQVLT